jgi:hypothetical protein
MKKHNNIEMLEIAINHLDRAQEIAREHLDNDTSVVFEECVIDLISMLANIIEINRVINDDNVIFVNPKRWRRA